MPELRVAIVGAGVIGLATAYQLARSGTGHQVTVIDRDPEADGASTVNAGGIAVTEVFPAGSPGVWWRAFGWMRDPLGPLSIRAPHALKLLPWLIRFASASRAREVERISRAMAALNTRVYDDLVPMLEQVGYGHRLHRKGALSLYESEAGYQRDVPEWACKRSHGIIAEDLTAEDARRMEPALGPRVHRAVFTPQWSHIEDPKELMASLRAWLMGHGVTIRRGEVRTIQNRGAKLYLQVVGDDAVSADRAVVAAGAWSGILARRLGDRVLLESERGYNTTLPESGIEIRRELIFAERKFVATPLSCGLRIGGAAEFGGLGASANFQRSQALVELARQSLPGLRTEGGTVWAGHRPTTPDSLPVIGPSPHEPSVLYAFGHGHFGLTQAATTGRLIADLIHDRRPGIDLAPYSIDRFCAPKKIRDGATHVLLH